MKTTYKTYRVTVVPVGFVAGRTNEPDEIDRDFMAKTSADAIRQAKEYMADTCGWTRAYGQIKFKAQRANA